MLNCNTFIRNIIPSAVSLAILPHLACAASGIGGVVEGRVLVNTGLGPMWLAKKVGKSSRSITDADGCPWALIDSMPDRLYSRARFKAPMVRRNFLRNREKSDRAGRGSGDFVEISWDQAAKLVTEEVQRVKTTYGNTSLHRGNSSWASNHARIGRQPSPAHARDAHEVARKKPRVLDLEYCLFKREILALRTQRFVPAGNAL
jgi:hypothetical protein